ncbi:hypothetical protein [uncultured Flavobacterium sp.]|uniref:hypothetical protein n=1 Tax=uncultured Flavobacterium sp. TaxID=165435 RepID=UPI0030CA4D05|tara:strand:- start:1027 stop:1662 length:636 start_codon:yes stop_codon:yes gene_type:complete
MPAIKQLFIYMKANRIRPSELEKNIGLSNGYLKTQLNRNGSIGENIINKIVSYYKDLNPLWLLFHQGDMLLKKEKDTPIENHSISLNGIKLENSISKKTIEIWLELSDFIMEITDVSMEPKYTKSQIIVGKKVMDKNLIIYGKDYMILTAEYKILRRIQKSNIDNSVLACAYNQNVWQEGNLKNILLYEPFDLNLEHVNELYEIVGSICKH